MEKAKDYKKYLRTLKKITKPQGMSDLEKDARDGRFTLHRKIKKLFKKRTGGAMLKNPGKADLDKDGKLSGYEKKRGMAIEKAMGAKRGKFAKTRRPKFGSDVGRKTLPDLEFESYNKMRDMIDTQRKMQQRKKDMEKDKQKISEKKKGIAVKSGGMMKYNKGGGADTGKIGELKSRLGVLSDKVRRKKKMIDRIGGRTAPKRPKPQAPKRGPMKPLKAKEGKAVLDPMTRGALESMSSKNPMKRDRLREGVRARSKERRKKQITDFIKRLKTAGRSLTPGGAAAPIAKKIGEKISKKSVGGNVLHKLKSQKEIKKITDSDEYKKADYFGKTKMLGGKAYTAKEMEKKISKKMGGGMMMKPMGYKSGTSVMARGCKLGRKKATKIM